MKQISFDLETLDTRASSVILSIGAVVFDETALYEEMKVNINIDEQLRWGRTISGTTLLFWFQQTDKARVAATMAPVAITSALTQFRNFIVTAGGVKTPLWVNGQDFDLGILGNLYDTLGVARPWAYNVGRDMRTLVDLYGSKPPLAFDGEAHDALADAKHQARMIQLMQKEIKNARQVSKTTS